MPLPSPTEQATAATAWMPAGQTTAAAGWQYHLPADTPRPAPRGPLQRTGVLEVPVPAAGGAASERDRALFTAALACLLYRYTATHAVVLGVHDEAEGVRGTVTVRLTGRTAAGALLEQAAQSAVLRLSEGTTGSKGSPRHRLRIADPGSAALSPGSHMAEHEIELVAARSGNVLRVQLEYRADLFHLDRAERMATHCMRLLRSLVDEPGRAVGDLSMLDDAEREQVGRAWARGPAPDTGPRTIVELIATQAAGRPDATALIAGAERVGYRALHERAGAAAQALAGLGVGPETVVALTMPRGVDAVVAMLAVLRAGGAALPLPPDLPPARLAGILAEAKPVLVLTDKTGVATEGAPPARPPVRTLHDLAAAGAPPARLLRGPHPLSAALVFYTSGSTGAPKGVVVPHSALAVLADAGQPVAAHPGEPVVLHSPLAFDASSHEIWSPLACGGIVHIAGPEPLSLEEYRELAATGGQLYLSSRLFDSLVEQGLTDFSGLRQLHLGGEQVSREHLGRIRPAAQVVNNYGPTECTTHCVVAPLDPAERDGMLAAHTPVGRPITGADAYVLGEELELLPEGVTGELYISGALVTRGYLHKPGLTADRFLPDPHNARPGSRMYRTGDLARWLPDGRLVVLGRRDDQVKVRGYRVEPAEIERTLRAAETVAAAHVLVRRGPVGGARLLAYVVLHEPATPLDGLREHLRRHLPEYFQPHALIALDRLPLTPSGKIDRSALPDPQPAPTPAPAGDASPTAALRSVIAVMAQVLEAGSLGPDESFFDRGGDSLMAMRVVAELRELGIRLSLKDFYNHDTPRTAAAHATVEDH